MRPRGSEYHPALYSQEGELLSVGISVEPRLLEELLEALAGLGFPVNPQLYHDQSKVIVEFPVYSERVEEVRNTLHDHGLNSVGIELAPYSGKAVAG